MPPCAPSRIIFTAKWTSLPNEQRHFSSYNVVNLYISIHSQQQCFVHFKAIRRIIRAIGSKIPQQGGMRLCCLRIVFYQ
jgi:hypothetical protein